MRRIADSLTIGGPVDYVVPKSRSKAPAPIGTIYFIGPEQGVVKIGFTNNLDVRLKRLQCGSPVPLYVLARIEGQPQTLEREYHARFASAREHGEWFLRTIDVNEEIERLNPSAS
jgi:hypothetical protein